MPTYFPFDPHPRPPSWRLPAGACDSQFHVFGAPETYRPRPGATYTMPTATVEKLQALHRTLGVDRGVIVQPTTYGSDLGAALDALDVLGPGYRVCANAALLAEASDSALGDFDARGVRGARFSRASLGLTLTPEQRERALGRANELGWYVKVQPEVDGVADGLAAFESLSCPLVIDHLGRPDPEKGLEDPSVIATIDWLGRENVWVMISLIEKISKAGPPWEDVIPIVRAYLEAAPDRVIWASDWPHPVSDKRPPNEGQLLDFLAAATDETERRRILVDNPARLFGFHTFAATPELSR